MAAKWQRVRLEIPRNIGPRAREAIGIELRNRMQERAEAGVGVNAAGTRSKRFPGYTEEYAKKKGQTNVDLLLEGDMLAGMNLISHRPGSVLIGFQNGTEENAKAEGNILGSYGRSPNPKKARNFLGLPAAEIRRIIKENADG